MPEEFREFRTTDPSLNTVGAGLALANEIVKTLLRGESVHLDLTAAQRMTPSFANALVMTMLEAVGEAAFHARVRLSTSADPVAEAWSKAIERYKRGIRLSTQRPGAA